MSSYKGISLFTIFTLLLLSGCGRVPSSVQKPHFQDVPELKRLEIGTMEPQGTDAGYWFCRREMSEKGPTVFNYFDDEHIQMKINGKVVYFKPLPSTNPQVWKFQSGEISAVLNTGPVHKIYGKIGNMIATECDHFSQAVITVTEPGYDSISIPVKGTGCED